MHEHVARGMVAGVMLSRPLRILIASLVGALAALGIMIARPLPAAAAGGDQIDSFTINSTSRPAVW